MKMKKLGKSSELLWVMGICFVAFGVAICKKVNLGVSMVAAPTFVVWEAIEKLWSGFSVGVTEYLVQGLFLIVMCIAIQRFNWRYLLCFASAVIYGYTLDLFIFLMRNIEFNGLLLRWIMLVVGDAVVSFGVACFFKTYMPLQVHELFVAEVTKRYGLKLNRVKLAFDMSLLILSIVLAIVIFRDITSFDFSKFMEQSYHNIGPGTFLTTVINTPFIAGFSLLLDKIFNPTPAIPGLKKAIGTK
ncbi:MAG: DUF6198 family protein [Clostridia bacterium]|nr:DUF6198 family protein [Clostridia bacterium]